MTRTTSRPRRRREQDPTPSGTEDPEVLLGHYRRMLLVRRFEERAGQEYTRARIGGYCHLNLGEEATVVGLMAALEPTDYVFTSYRDHGYALARGVDPGRVMAELFGRATGVSKGWGGSMHLFDVDTRLLGGYGIVGGQIPLATGAALAVAYRQGTEVVLCHMGDGATNIGAFHESLNLASLWRLPVVYVVVNNELGMGTPVERSSAEPELHRRAAAYRMTGERVDGNDVLAVRDAARRAVERARRGEPTLLETMSGRLRGHSVVDPARYRTPAERDRLAQADPVARLRGQLLAAGVLTEQAAEALDAEVGQVVEAATEFAEHSPHPEVDTLFDHTHATPVPGETRRLPADPLFPEDQ